MPLSSHPDTPLDRAAGLILSCPSGDRKRVEKDELAFVLRKQSTCQDSIFGNRRYSYLELQQITDLLPGVCYLRSREMDTWK